MSGPVYRKRVPKHVFPVIAELQAKRRERGIGRVPLAVDLGYSPTSLGRWERGEFYPSLQALHDWCEGLGVALRIS